MRRVFGRFLVWAVVALVLAVTAAAAGIAWLGEAFETPGPALQVTRVQVPPGQGVRAMLQHLQNAGVLRSGWQTALYLRLHGLHPTLQAGKYDIPAQASPADIIEMIEDGRVVLEQITVVEGARFADFRALLESTPSVRVTLKGRSDAAVMDALGHHGQDPEGAFFPDTYRFADGTSDLDILKLAYASMQRELAAAWSQRAQDLPFDTPQQALILASMVEKETALPDERPHIAGVFINRLRKGMRLQSDPTVIYGLGSRYDGMVHSRDLSRDTPYNTYTRSGLPPTPIALPGRAALMAAVQPLQTDDLYFVATADGNGGHHFSATLAEHNQAVKRYLARLRAAAKAS